MQIPIFKTGFLVPKSAYTSNPTPSPIDYTSWKACRSAQCGATVGGCNPNQPPTPFSDHVSTTSASVMTDTFNSLGRAVKRSCRPSGLIQNQPYMNNNLKLDATHLAQYVYCDYQGTSFFPSITLSREAVESGQFAPPSPPPSLPVGGNGVVTGGSPPTPTTSTGVNPSPPVVPKPQGPTVVFVASLAQYSTTTFNETVKASYVKAVQRAAIGRYFYMVCVF